MRDTFSGHAEFDLHLEACSAGQGQGEVVWAATLSIVLMKPGGGKKAAGSGAKKVRAGERVCVGGGGHVPALGMSQGPQG